MKTRKIKSAKAIFDKETEAMFVILTEYGDENSCIRDALYTYTISIRHYNNASEFFGLQAFLNNFDIKKIVIYNVGENKKYDYCIDKLISISNILGFKFSIRKGEKNDDNSRNI